MNEKIEAIKIATHPVHSAMSVYDDKDLTDMAAGYGWTAEEPFEFNGYTGNEAVRLALSSSMMPGGGMTIDDQGGMSFSPNSAIGQLMAGPGGGPGDTGSLYEGGTAKPTIDLPLAGGTEDSRSEAGALLSEMEGVQKLDTLQSLTSTIGAADDFIEETSSAGNPRVLKFDNNEDSVAVNTVLTDAVKGHKGDIQNYDEHYKHLAGGITTAYDVPGLIMASYYSLIDNGVSATDARNVTALTYGKTPFEEAYTTITGKDFG